MFQKSNPPGVDFWVCNKCNWIGDIVENGAEK